jgi:hypothetical protein
LQIRLLFASLTFGYPQALSFFGVFLHMLGSFNPNDWVVYTREKHSLSPGPRAKNITPSPYGEMYSYEVDKYWIVRQVKEDELVLETRRGKVHTLPTSDTRLRKASFWERTFFSHLFPPKNSAPENLNSGAPNISH